MKYLQYPDYIHSDVEWLDHIPAHWILDRIKWSVTGCINGVWGDEPDGENDLVCVRVADFDRQTNRVQSEEYTYRAVPKSKRLKRQLQQGDLLIEKSGGGEQQAVGVVVLFEHNFDAVCSNFVARMPVENGFDPNYLCYLHCALYSAKINTRSIKQNTGIQNLDSSAYLDEKVGFPPLEEQKSIAAFLDHETAQIDTLIAKQQQMIELLQEKRQALISHAVTKGLNPDAPMKDSESEWFDEIPTHWKISRLKYAATHVVDCPHSTPAYDENGDYHVIRTADVSPGRLDLSNTRMVNESEYSKRIERLEPKSNDILYSREGERYGMAALVPPGAKVCLGQRMMHFRTNDHEYDPAFLMWVLNADCVYTQAQQDVIGTTSPHVNVATIRNFVLVEPPIKEQRTIANYLSSETKNIDKIIEKAHLSILLLSERRTALISAAVTGKIDVRSLVN